MKQTPHGKKKWNGWELAYPEDYPCEEAYLPLVRFIDYCAKSSNEQLQTGIPKWFYMDNLRDYMVFLLSQGILDNLFKNAYLSVVDKSKGNRMLITPWDLDCSLGGSWNGSYYTNPIWKGFILSAELPRRLWEGNVAGFKGLVYDRWQALRQTVLSEEAFCRRLDAYARMFEESGAWERECAKWNGNPVPLKRNISEELDYVKDWYHRNAEELANHIFLGVESGVKEMKISAPLRPSHSVVYNLSGQRVSSYYKGLVIVDGHKMVRR